MFKDHNISKLFYKNFFLIYLITILFFPFFIKVEFFFLKLYIKDILIFFSIFFLIFFWKLFNNTEKKLINKTLKLLTVIYILSISFIFIKFTTNFQISIELNGIDFQYYLEKYTNLFLRSIFVTFGGASLYFILNKIIDEKKIIHFFKFYYFACLIILFEFILHLFLKEFFIELNIVNKIYNPNIFRSIFLNGHIMTSIFLSIGLFVGFFLKKKIQFKFLNTINIILILPIIYNFETRLTILAFSYILLVYCSVYFFKIKNIDLKLNLIFYTILIATIIIFSESNQNSIYEIILGKTTITTDSLFDRLNINLISLIAFLNYPFGYGFEMYNAYLDFLFIPSIHTGHFDYKQLYGSFITFHDLNYLEYHGDFSKPHSGILNFLTSFGIFIVPLFFLIKKFNKIQIKFSYDFDLYILIKSSFLFLILVSFINYTSDIEVLFILIAVLFTKMKRSIYEK